MATPCELEVLLHCYYTGGEPVPRNHAPAVRDAISFWRSHDMLEPHSSVQQDWDSIYKTTPRGDAYVKALCCVPLPESRWYIPAQEAKHVG